MNNLLGVMGLACRAGKIKFGTEQTVQAVRSPVKPALVCVAYDASDNSKKRLFDSCNYHNVQCVSLPTNKAELGRAIGKTMDVSAVAVTDDNFRAAIMKQLENNNTSGDRSAGGAIYGSNEN